MTQRYKGSTKTLGILALVFASAITAALGCGSRKDEDEKTRLENSLNESKTSSETLIIAGNTTNSDAVAMGKGCEVELKQSSEFDPSKANSQLVVVFRGKIDAACLNNKQPEVKLYSKTKLSIPGATCGPSSGEFNIRCSGDIVRSNSLGQIEISFEARDNLEELRTLRVKVAYSDK
jgi:hypothetical protein